MGVPTTTVAALEAAAAEPDQYVNMQWRRVNTGALVVVLGPKGARVASAGILEERRRPLKP